MSLSAPTLLAAAGVGFGHAVLPDHWAPLAVMGRTRRFKAVQVARISAAAGIAHVIVSVILGAAIIVIGLQFRSAVAHTEDALVGGILIATGVGFALMEWTGHGHHHGPDGHTHVHSGHDDYTHGPSEHHHRDHSHDVTAGPSTNLLAAMIPFGAAASPDLTILPVFLASAAAGTSAAVGSLVVFAAVTIGTIVTLTLLAFATGRLIHNDWLERWGNIITAGVLVVIGLLVATGTI